MKQTYDKANLLAATATTPQAISQVDNVAVGDRTTRKALYSEIHRQLLPRDPKLQSAKPRDRDVRPGDVRHSLADPTTPIAVIGRGYVRLPLEVEFGKQRPVIGFDINHARVAELQAGRDSTRETTPEDLAAARCINDRMGAHVAERVVKLMLKQGIDLSHSRVLVLGLTFKKTLLRGAPRTCRRRNFLGPAQVADLPRAEAVDFLVACDPGKKPGPGTVANLRVVTPAGDPD